MNLARFGLLKTPEGVIVPEGEADFVEISEQEALSTPNALKFDSIDELLGQARSLGVRFSPYLESQFALDEYERHRRSMQMSHEDPIPPKRKRKYVKHEKKTAKNYVEKTKKKLGIVDFDKPVLTVDKNKVLTFHLSADEVLELFPKKNNSQKLDKNRFARNIVWQIYRLSQSEKPPDFIKEGCNMRTIFYLFKPTLTANKIFTDNTEKTKREKNEDEGDIDSFYGNFTKAVQDLVLQGLISYRDLSIQDDRKSFRFLPPAKFNTHVLLLAEKKAFLGRFLTLASRYGVMAQITRGRSTYLMTDTMLTEMFELGYDFSKNLSILSFCDFDPVGSSIPFHFVKHLKELGFHNVNHFEQYGDQEIYFEIGEKDDKPVYKKLHQKRPCLDIVNPHEFDAATRIRMRHKLKSSLQDDNSTKEWSLITGGVTGTGKNTEYAISAEQFLPYVEVELEKKLPPLLAVPPEKVGLSSRLRLLTRELQRHIGIRALKKAQKLQK